MVFRMEAEKDKLVSIIVPVYKVEKYIDTCIRSLVQQTYKKIEILLIDDGSPDCCGDICDSWAIIDDRIKVIHKSNGGLSDARNAGLDMAKGEYILFVDSDDYIDENLVEICVRSLFHYNADFVAMGIVPFQNESDIICDAVVQNSVYYDGYEVLRNGIMNHLFTVCAWNKLYKKDVWNNLRFPPRMLHEDYYIFSDVLKKCNRVVCLDKPLYFYRQNPESIMHNRSIRNHYDLAKAKLHTMENMIEWPELYYYAKKIYLEELMDIYFEEIRENKKNILQEFRKQFGVSWKYMKLKWIFNLTAFYISPFFQRMIYKTRLMMRTI